MQKLVELRSTRRRGRRRAWRSAGPSGRTGRRHSSSHHHTPRLAARLLQEEKPRVILGRPGNNVSAGLVGMPNVGKSTTFNIMCNMTVPAENFPVREPLAGARVASSQSAATTRATALPGRGHRPVRHAPAP